MEKNLQYYLDQLKALNFKDMYENDFLPYLGQNR